jgi:hypothetical protein
MYIMFYFGRFMIHGLGLEHAFTSGRTLYIGLESALHRILILIPRTNIMSQFNQNFI